MPSYLVVAADVERCRPAAQTVLGRRAGHRTTNTIIQIRPSIHHSPFAPVSAYRYAQTQRTQTRPT
jgi:hypothetical protein